MKPQSSFKKNPPKARSSPSLKKGKNITSLSSSAAEYCETLINPWSEVLAKIPNMPVLNTRTAKVFLRGTFFTGAVQTGFFTWSPRAMAVGNSISAFWSGSGYAANTIAAGPIAGQVFGVSSNAEYLTASVGTGNAQVQYRVVSCGCKISNITPMLTRGGNIVGGMHPSHVSWVGNTNQTMLQTTQEVIQLSAGTNDAVETKLIYRTVDVQDTDFSTSVPVPGDPNDWYMAFMITSSQQQEYSYDCVANIEYQGLPVTGKSPSYADASGHTAVSTVVSLVPALKSIHQHLSDRLALAGVQAADHVANHSTGGNTDSKEHHSSFMETIGTIFRNVAPVAGPLLSIASTLL